jgi:hypothetical protein
VRARKAAGRQIPEPGTARARGVSEVSPQCLAKAVEINSSRKGPVRAIPMRLPQFDREILTRWRCDEIKPLNVPLLELAPNGCRWPSGNGSRQFPYTFCDHTQIEGSSYCLSHYALSIGPGTSSERRAA